MRTIKSDFKSQVGFFEPQDFLFTLFEVCDHLTYETFSIKEKKTNKQPSIKQKNTWWTSDGSKQILKRKFGSANGPIRPPQNEHH